MEDDTGNEVEGEEKEDRPEREVKRQPTRRKQGKKERKESQVYVPLNVTL